LKYQIESSPDMQTWYLEETIIRDVDIGDGKVFLRLDYGPSQTSP
jgi:hypothetical protein